MSANASAPLSIGILDASRAKYTGKAVRNSDTPANLRDQRNLAAEELDSFCQVLEQLSEQRQSCMHTFGDIFVHGAAAQPGKPSRQIWDVPSVTDAVDIVRRGQLFKLRPRRTLTEVQQSVFSKHCCCWQQGEVKRYQKASMK